MSRKRRRECLFPELRTHRLWRLSACVTALLLAAGVVSVSHASVAASASVARRQAAYTDAGGNIACFPLMRGASAFPGQGESGKDSKGDSALLQAARTAFESGNLPEAAATAAQVTSPELKGAATGIINRVSNYNAAMAAAQGAERAKDVGRAIHLYTSAANIAHNGPGDPNGRIAALRAGQTASAGNEGAGAGSTTPTTAPSALPINSANSANSPSSTTSANTANPTHASGASTPLPVSHAADQTANATTALPTSSHPSPSGDTQAKVNRLLAAAHGAEASGDLPSALKGYEEVEHLQPGNMEGATGHLRVETAIHRDPAEQAKTLAQAIRDFYSLKYGDTEDELTSYLSSPQARSRGAAYFYQGATRLYRRVLEGQQKPEAAIRDAAVQRSFTEARAAGYEPVARFVSPLLMRAWQVTP